MCYNLYQQNFSDQIIEERTGHRSIEALHKYKRTGTDQKMNVSMALLPKLGKENVADDDDLKPVKKNLKWKILKECSLCQPLTTAHLISTFHDFHLLFFCYFRTFINHLQFPCDLDV